MTVRISDEAQHDIEAIYAYYDERSEGAADRIVATLIRSLRGLERFPLLGKPGHYPDTREHTVPRYGYRIIYEIAEDAGMIGVIRILHGAQRWAPVTP